MDSITEKVNIYIVTVILTVAFLLASIGVPTPNQDSKIESGALPEKTSEITK